MYILFLLIAVLPYQHNINSYSCAVSPNEYSALISQDGTNPPTAYEITNTTGATITWTYEEGDGYWAHSSVPVFNATKTVCPQINTVCYSVITDNVYAINGGFQNDSTFIIKACEVEGGGLIDGVLYRKLIQILIYP